MTKSGILLLFAMLLLSLLSPFTLSMGQEKEKLPPSPYYPLQVGNTWNYRDGKETMTVRVVAHEKVGNDLCAKIEATQKGTTRVEYITVTKDGLYRVKTKDKLLNPPLCLLQLPPKKGASWKVDSKIDNLKITGNFRVTEEEVTVPAGKYKAIRSACKDMAIGSRTISVTYWFVRDVGIVKQSMELGDVEVNLELEKFESAK